MPDDKFESRGLEANGSITLEDGQYRRFIMKLMNEDQDNLGQKLAHTDDVINAYFFQPETSDYIKAELDTQTKSITAENNTYLIYDKYINNDVVLLHSELRSNQMYNEIADSVKDLKDNHNITYEPNLFSNLVDKFESNYTEHTTHAAIKDSYNDLLETNHALDKINNLLENVKQYREEYNADNILNQNLYSNSFEQNAKVDIYFDSMSEMKKLYESQKEFQEITLKIQVEEFLKDKSNIYKNIELESTNTDIAKYISTTKPTDLTTGRLLPLVMEANNNEMSEKIRSNIFVHSGLDYMNLNLKQMELYNPQVSYQDSKLQSFIETSKQKSLANVIDYVSKEMKSIYGQGFNLFKQEELELPSNKIFDKVDPIVQNDTFSIYELQKIEPVTKKDYEIRDFWESKNLEMLMDYKQSKNVSFEAKIEDMYFESKNYDKVITKIPELVDENTDFSKRTLGRFKEGIEDTQHSLYQLRLALATDKDKLQLDPEKNHSPEEKAQHNRLMNNLLNIKNLENKMEQLSGYINLVENTRTSQKVNERETELER